ncbi:hypothetical protein CTAYLR_003559 [Chrysophaeum taylorii]|uniref:PH domain-containing protein n=1 Tax=Chrysophaeum taylorii TaxID=2483200 RepID=A0AAD7XQJ6_9STRA|nr:hypothetical protein CTAYLR_003559 [Chrysophaeum taylorii]
MAPAAAAASHWFFEGPVAIQGHLHKEGHLVKSWKRRMFFLKVRPAILEYYDDDSNKNFKWEFKGRIDLANATLVDGQEPLAFKLVATTGKRFNLRCDDAQTKTRWLAVVAKVIAGNRDPDDVFATWTAHVDLAHHHTSDRCGKTKLRALSSTFSREARQLRCGD